MAAIATQPDRTAALAKLTIPTTVLHGRSDPLIHRSGGRATAKAIAEAEHLEIEGMGHDMPKELWDTIIDAIVKTAERAG
jgi:pimeloyl-ACP methyl ester carboxylesterase